MENLTLEQLKELALGLNELSTKRYKYLLDETNEKYREDNERFLQMDRDLIAKISQQIKILREEK